MLENTPILITEQLKVLIEMGHRDEIAIAYGNFSGANYAQGLIRCDGQNIPALLDAILQLLPLEAYVKQPVALMQVEAGDPVHPVI